MLPIAEITAKLDAVDETAVRRFGARMMETASPTLVALGPVGKLEAYSTFANRFGALRRAAE